MAKKKKTVKKSAVKETAAKAKKATKRIKPKKHEPKEDLTTIAKRRDEMIALIQPKLLTVTQMKKGTREIRNQNAKEQGYLSSLIEINELGKKLGLRPIGLGHLRRQ